MKDYIYDGTFEGLLCCIYAAYYDEPAASISKSGEGQISLLSLQTIVETDIEKSDKVYDAIRKKISAYDLRRIYKVYLSNDEDKEMKILRYVQMGFKYGSNISNFHGNDIVEAVQKIEKKVGNEVHRLYGLVRFKELQGGIMYTGIEPDHDVIQLMAAHFSERFQSAPFILHDQKRGKAVFSAQGKWYMTAFTEKDLPEQSQGEKDYQKMWKMYFEHIAIKERKNSRCQRNFMPARYWKNMTEFDFSKDL